MILASVGMIFTIVSVAILVRLRESHFNVNQFLQEMDVSARTSSQPASSGETEPATTGSSDVLFTENLLALSKVGLRAPGGSPALAPAESSSLVSVRPDQSKTHVQAL
jgi:hypothetical protein